MILRSKRLGEDFELLEGRSLIGRHQDCAIVLESNLVSKSHLHLDVDGSRVRVRDKNSRNNSKVNHAAIQGQGWIDLKVNDVVDICGFDFRLLKEAPPSGTVGDCIVQMSNEESTTSGLSNPGSREIPLSKNDLNESDQFSQLKALLAITDTLRDVIKTEDVLERAVSMLFKILPTVDRAAICFIDEEQDEVTPKWWQVRERDPDSTIRISQHIGRHVAETSKAMITSDALADFSEAKSVQALSMRSVMCCPLIDAEGKVFGMIHVDAAMPNRFGELDLEVLAAVAMQVSLAINCSRLHAIAVEDELLRRDVEQAREVQERYLPDEPPLMVGYDLAGFYRAARHVGGDYFDYVPLDDGRLAIVLGDVVGKGVPAALTMVRLASETRTGLSICQSPSELVTRLNQNFPDDFVTLVVLVLDPKTNELTIANAGHEPPLLRSADGLVRDIGFEVSGCPLSVLPDFQYEETKVPLDEGDTIVIFSDGFPDEPSPSTGERFGSGPIAESLASFEGSANATIQHLVDRVDEFIEGGPQFDDMCMVCLKRKS
ncbi:MAG: SpoIIE family protein phosphatase [Planctomycetota bacterium]